MRRPSAAARTPPFRIPGQHFAAASVFLAAGAGLLAAEAGALAAGAFSHPGVIAATHLLTLGWIGTSIMGALYQFLPVALGTSVRWERLTDATFGAWVAGVVAFVAGLLTGNPDLHVAGAGALGVAILLFAVNIAATLPAATRRGLTWWCVAGGTLALVGAWVLGALLSVNLTTDILGGTRFTVLAVHMHVAAGGWVLLTIIGVADRLLPMFLLSHGADTRAGRVAAALVAGATALLLLSEHVLPVGVITPALAMMAAGAAAFLLQAFLYYRNRRRPRLDPGLRLVAGALTLLTLAVCAGVAALAGPSPSPRMLTVYGVLLVPGGLGLFVAGHYYKIVPFLTWYHRFGPVASERDVPQVGELFHHGTAHGAVGLLVGGVAVLAVGVGAVDEGIALVGALLFLAGTLVHGGQMLSIARKRPG